MDDSGMARAEMGAGGFKLHGDGAGSRGEGGGRKHSARLRFAPDVGDVVVSRKDALSAASVAKGASDVLVWRVGAQGGWSPDGDVAKVLLARQAGLAVE